jgi:predicted NBD/HSP70 family sugar kinase
VNLSAVARSYKGGDELTDEEFLVLPAEVARAVSNGDKTAVKTVQAVANSLASAAVALVNIFNPATIVLGGPMSPILELCLDDIRSRITAEIVPGVTIPEVRLSALGIFDCAIGAACIAHHHLFDISNFELSEP